MKRKVFRALESNVVEKQFIASDAETPSGWFDTPQEAMEAFVDDEAPKRRGRPRKEAE